MSQNDKELLIPRYEFRRIINSYDRPIVRAYCHARFFILRQRFIREIGQYLPASGRVLDLGCGFGLFGLTYAIAHPGCEIHGVDLNPGRIAQANQAAQRLGLGNASFKVADVTSAQFQEIFDAAYLIDIIHHIPPAAVEPLLKQLHALLKAPGCRLVVKDVGRSPAYKRWFTWWLDKAMDYRAPVHYWEPQALQQLLRQVGFEVHYHEMVDYLPYPHVIYICEKK